MRTPGDARPNLADSDPRWARRPSPRQRGNPGRGAAALDAGADGVGLLRTELAFLEANHWPTAAEHRRSLEPVLIHLHGLTATVRLLDFGGDKTPPFLKGCTDVGSNSFWRISRP